MSEVDLEWAYRRAKELADERVRHAYRPQERESMSAGLFWARQFNKEYRALTQPNPKGSQ